MPLLTCFRRVPGGFCPARRLLLSLRRDGCRPADRRHHVARRLSGQCSCSDVSSLFSSVSRFSRFQCSRCVHEVMQLNACLVIYVHILSEFVRADVVDGRNRPFGDVSQPGAATLLSCPSCQVTGGVVYMVYMGSNISGNA